jgi:hypothetical protein
MLFIKHGCHPHRDEENKIYCSTGSLGLGLTISTLLVVVIGLLFANTTAQKNPEGWGAMKYPQLVLGMLALFSYVGVEVSIGSNLGELLKTDCVKAKIVDLYEPYYAICEKSKNIYFLTAAPKQIREPRSLFSF